MATKECEKVIEQIPLYIDNMLSKSESDEVLKHIEKCPDCKNEYNYLKAIMAKTTQIPQKELPKDFHKNLMQRITTEKKKRRHIILRRVSAYVAAAAVVAMSFVALGQFENSGDSEIKEQYITSRLSDEPISEEATKEKLTSIESKLPIKPEEPKNEIVNEEQIPASISIEEEVGVPVKATVTITDDILDEIAEMLSPYEKDATGYIVEDIGEMIKKLKEKGAKIVVSTDRTVTQNYIIIK